MRAKKLTFGIPIDVLPDISGLFPKLTLGERFINKEGRED
jgi:hypothetical protein